MVDELDHHVRNTAHLSDLSRGQIAGLVLHRLSPVREPRGPVNEELDELRPFCVLQSQQATGLVIVDRLDGPRDPGAAPRQHCIRLEERVGVEIATDGYGVADVYGRHIRRLEILAEDGGARDERNVYASDLAGQL